ncbi:unnamed protein product, partial [Mesorhabditis belari]|uniref:Uncharacterized protein n=1 Tax=Mesorhabditis belari TaxID=2138241 RepID=A0AAF3FIQ7_9BILA
MPLQSLIAQIGGQFSLWAGGSLISLLQLVIYLSRHFYHRCHRAVRHQRRKSLAAAAARRASTRRSSSIPRSSKVLNGNSLTHHLIRIEPDSLEKVPV